MRFRPAVFAQCLVETADRGLALAIEQAATFLQRRRFALRRFDFAGQFFHSALLVLQCLVIGLVQRFELGLKPFVALLECLNGALGMAEVGLFQLIPAFGLH